jgi:hypothetical protein
VPTNEFVSAVAFVTTRAKFVELYATTNPGDENCVGAPPVVFEAFAVPKLVPAAPDAFVVNVALLESTVNPGGSENK